MARYNGDNDDGAGCWLMMQCRKVSLLKFSVYVGLSFKTFLCVCVARPHSMAGARLFVAVTMMKIKAKLMPKI